MFNFNSFGQSEKQITLICLTRDMSFRMKKVEFHAEKIFGPEITKEKYILFEFPNDTLTHIVFTDQIRKKELKNFNLKESNISFLNTFSKNENLVIFFKNKYYLADYLPNSLVGSSTFFTNNEEIYVYKKHLKFKNVPIGESVFKHYGYKYDIPIGNKRLQFEIVIDEVDRIKNLYTLITKSYGSEYNPPDYIYEADNGIYNIFGKNYFVKVKEILK